MQAKYFLEKNLLEAMVRRRPSFAWRNIHSSCALFNKGLVWRVGNGCKIRIWKDRWLLNPSTYCIFSPPSILDPNATISELLKGEPKW
jgi:hypothetical protein